MENRHVPYGRIDDELVYENGNPRLKSLEKLGYKINERNFSDIKPIFKNSKDYQKFRFPYEEMDGVYIGAEHCNANSSTEEIIKKRVNLTFFGNLEAKLNLNGKKAIVMASSMGHKHPLDLDLQEIYEFKGYGAMIIEKPRKETKIIFTRPGGKIAVPGNCHMTIYNLDLKPLETQDFANPKQNESDKKIEKENGPMFCIYYIPEDKSIFFSFNYKYMNTNHFTNKMEILVPIKNENNFGEELFQKSQEESFRKDFGKIKISDSYHTKIPGIKLSDPLEEIVEHKSSDFCK